MCDDVRTPNSIPKTQAGMGMGGGVEMEAGREAKMAPWANLLPFF